ncbi:MAG: PH domain-containing protein [Acidimicrobiia bacterium]|nr:PH domain-containing protein [Acidimicrobiia bacterium]
MRGDLDDVLGRDEHHGAHDNDIAHDDDGAHHDDGAHDDDGRGSDVVTRNHVALAQPPVPFPRRLLDEGEVVVLDLRPHWWVLARSTALLVLSLAVAVTVSIVVPGVAHDPVLIASLILVLVVLVRFIRRYARWGTTNMVLTTERLVVRTGVFVKRGREIPLERINDITYRQRLFERMIGAGDLFVESGGERGQQVLRMVPRPVRVQQAIHRQVMQSRAVANDEP